MVKIKTKSGSAEVLSDRLAQVIEDFMQLRMTTETLLPTELSDLRNKLDRMSINGKAPDAAKYSLCHRVGSALYQKENLTMGELGKILGVPLSTATRMVDWLVERGYAVRMPDPEDRRIVRIALTDTGRHLQDAMNEYMQQRLDELLAVLTPEELENFLILLHKVAVAFRTFNEGKR